MKIPSLSFRAPVVRSAIVAFLLPSLVASSAPPAWWMAGNPPVIDANLPSSNKGMANVGQAKWMAWNALEALREILPDVAEQVEADLVGAGKPISSWAAPVTQEEKDAQRAPLLQGQLKSLAAAFYDALHASHASWLAGERIANGTNVAGTHYPWTATITDDAHHAPVTVGQLKAVFSLRFETLPTVSHLDSDGDRLTDAEELLLGTDPFYYDTDWDLLPDGWEVTHGLDPLEWYDSLDDPDGDGIDNLLEYLLGFDLHSADSDNDGVPDSAEDRDGDGMPDNWEAKTGSWVWNYESQRSLFQRKLDWEVADASDDPDGDGLSNLAEYQNGTDPFRYDTDGDYLPDGWEVAHGFDPLSWYDGQSDPDGDGVQNQYEYILGFDPRSVDSDNDGVPDNAEDRDGDGMPDLWEAKTGSWVWNYESQRYLFQRKLDWEVADGSLDLDNDGLNNLEEYQIGTNPTHYDTDGDYLPDGWEVAHGLDPKSSSGVNGRTGDPDGDGIQNQYEYILGFDPRSVDSDNDGVPDNAEDRDDDGMPNAWEAKTGSWVWDYESQRYLFQRKLDWEVADASDDPDGDGLSNLAEYQNGTDPFRYDTDGDYLPDGWEASRGLDPKSSSGVNGRTGDPDGDGIQNQYEYILGFDPRSVDSDNDGVPDNAEDRDGDGMPDAWEAKTGSWVWDYESQRYLFQRKLDWEVADAAVDPDGDGLSNLAEYQNGTDPFRYDTDGDYLPDGWEVVHGFDPRFHDVPDADGDNIKLQDEITLGFNPYSADSDNNGTPDSQEDRDGDGLPDIVEFEWGTDYNNPSSGPEFDRDMDGLSYAKEISAGTDPTQPDTDLDTLPDGWEIANGFDPLVNNLTDGDLDNDPSADPDGDGLTNSAEADSFTFAYKHDSDGDGLGDALEIGQGTNPNDSNDHNPPPKGTAAVNITFGDSSGSHSEKYRVKLQPVEGDSQVRILTNRKYGETQTDMLRLRKGARYTVTLEHVSTDPKYKGNPRPDYDYTLEIEQIAASEKTLRIIKDTHGILGIHNESDTFFASGKTADLFVMHFKTETVSETPTNRDRKKLGVREESEVTVTPSSAGVINWTLTNHQDATVNPTNGYSVLFQADTRTKNTTLRATFDTGDIYEILWNIVQPTGERALKTSDFTYEAGTQGAGMTIEYTTLPDDVSFYQVEVLEVDRGTSNIVGFFSDFAASHLQHHPNPNWARLDPHNRWNDTAAFSGWGFPPSSGHLRSWKYGTYQWDIDVMWRTAGEGGGGLLLGTRTQLHTLHDSTGRSTESKSGVDSTRTP